VPAGTLPPGPGVSVSPGATVGGWYPRSRLHRVLAAFRQWRRSRPFWAGLWCLLAGIEIAYFPARAFRLLLVTGSSVVLGVTVGVVIALMGLFIWFTPQVRQVVGVIAVLFSVVSLVTSSFGGLVIGLVLGTVGGAMAFAWTPVKPKPRAE
jgi:hypothetical protein